MANRTISDVIYDIERCTCGVPDACRDCSKYRKVGDRTCDEQLLVDAMELLKSHEYLSKAEPVLQERVCEEYPNHYVVKGFCPHCNQEVRNAVNRVYCGFCGKKLKWKQ